MHIRKLFFAAALAASFMGSHAAQAQSERQDAQDEEVLREQKILDALNDAFRNYANYILNPVNRAFENNFISLEPFLKKNRSSQSYKVFERVVVGDEGFAAYMLQISDYTIRKQNPAEANGPLTPDDWRRIKKITDQALIVSAKNPTGAFFVALDPEVARRLALQTNSSWSNARKPDASRCWVQYEGSTATSSCVGLGGDWTVEVFGNIRTISLENMMGQNEQTIGAYVQEKAAEDIKVMGQPLSQHLMEIKRAVSSAMPSP